jgi:pyruvate/2-oxoglutarate dehydrogenase complex dihydrolipoamide acyltransferase (E2) component
VVARRRPVAIRLRVPAAPELRGPNTVVHWLKRPGDVISPNEVVEVLGARMELRAPANAAGQVEKLLAADGERVINREPLLRIRVQAAAPPGLRTLEEPPAVPFMEELSSRIVMEPVDKRTHRALAIVGGIAVVGIAIAALCLPIYLMVGGATLPAIGGLSLMIVAAALAYAQHILRQQNG